MKKVLIVMSSLYNGGAERSLVNMLNEFTADKYQIDLLLQKREGMFIQQLPPNVNLLETPKDLMIWYGSLKDAGMWAPWKIVSNIISRIRIKDSKEMRAFRWKHFYTKRINKLPRKYDVALAYISGEVLYYVSEKVDAKRKIVWIHNDYRSAKHPRKYDYPHLKKMNAIVSISESCVNILKEEFPEFSDKIYMLENITSSDLIRKRANEFVPKEFEQNRINLLSIGRLNEQKGFDMAISAAHILKKRGVTFCWYVIGNGELETNLKNQIINENVEDCFVLLGPKENPYPYIKAADIFVQPSRFEGKSVVLDEAKIIGVPIVATAYSTVGDQLKNNVEGMIVPLNVDGIVEGIEYLYNNENVRNEYVQYLKSNDYGNQQEIKKYIALLEE